MYEVLVLYETYWAISKPPRSQSWGFHIIEWRVVIWIKKNLIGLVSEQPAGQMPVEGYEFVMKMIIIILRDFYLKWSLIFHQFDTLVIYFCKISLLSPTLYTLIHFGHSVSFLIKKHHLSGHVPYFAWSIFNEKANWVTKVCKMV